MIGSRQIVKSTFASTMHPLYYPAHPAGCAHRPSGVRTFSVFFSTLSWLGGMLVMACSPPSTLDLPCAVESGAVEDAPAALPVKKRPAKKPPAAPPNTDAEACTPGAWTHNLQFGTADDDEALGLAADTHGNFYATGYRGGLAGTRNPTDIDPGGSSSAFLTMYDSSGTQLWTKSVSTTGSDSGESVVVRNDTAYWLGRTTGALSRFTNHGEFDNFIKIFASDGTQKGAIQFGDEKPQHLRSLALDAKGNPIAAGYDDRYIVDRTLRSNEISRVFKLNADLSAGTPSGWEYKMDDDLTSSNFAFGMAVDTAKTPAGIYLAGVRDNGAYVQKLSEDGAVLWRKRLTTFAIDPANAITVSHNGDLLVTGSTFLLLGGTRYGQQDAFVASIDKDTGELLWAVNAGTDEADWATAITTDASGDIYLGGETSGVLVPGYTPSGTNDQDLFVMRFASDGTLKGVWQRGAVGADHLAAMTVDSCGDLIIAGYTSGNLIGRGKHLGARDAFVMKIRAADWSSPE